jgi:hypothetical protein
MKSLGLFAILLLLLALGPGAQVLALEPGQTFVLNILSVVGPVDNPTPCTSGNLFFYSASSNAFVQFRANRTGPAGAQVSPNVRTIPAGGGATSQFGITSNGIGDGNPAVFLIDFVEEGTGAVLAQIAYDCSTRALSIAYFLDDSSGAAIAVADPLGDADGDGILNRDDNCVSLANTDQANTWGTRLLGNACDTNFYAGNNGVKAFQLLNGSFEVYGCQGDSCALIGTFGPQALQAGGRVSGAGWTAQSFFLGQEGANRVYQINVYNPAGALVDDKLQILLGGTSSAWRVGNGLTQGEQALGADANTAGGGTRDFAGFEPYVPNARVNPPGFTANPDVRPGDQAVATGNVRVRTAPDVNAAPTGEMIGWGVKVQVIEEYPGGYWFYVVAENGIEGWVANEWFAPVSQ